MNATAPLPSLLAFGDQAVAADGQRDARVSHNSPPITSLIAT